MLMTLIIWQHEKSWGREIFKIGISEFKLNEFQGKISFKGNDKILDTVAKKGLKKEHWEAFPLSFCVHCQARGY